MVFMEFPNTVRVNGKELDPLAKLTTLPPLLGLTIEDLRRVEREIQGKYDLGEINSGYSLYISASSMSYGKVSSISLVSPNKAILSLEV